MLTEKKAIERTIELWAWLAETGKDKYAWPGWEQYSALHFCFLCEYSFAQILLIESLIWSHNGCDACPYYQQFGFCGDDYYGKWCFARTVKTRKKYAGLFLEQLKQL